MKKERYNFTPIQTDELEKRCNDLRRLISEHETNSIADVYPKVHSFTHGDKEVYYLRKSPKEKNGTYIKQSELALVEKPIIMEYDNLLVKKARKELALIENFLRRFDNDGIANVYNNLSSGKKVFVHPCAELNESYAGRWQAEEYEHKAIAEDVLVLFTNKGEQVRSKSEVLIANALAAKGIPYKYEYPVKINTRAFSYMAHPDFTTLNKRTRRVFYWEHLGKMDDPSYVSDNAGKLIDYQNNGLIPGDNLILTFESLTTPLNIKTIQEVIDRILL